MINPLGYSQGDLSTLVTSQGFPYSLLLVYECTQENIKNYTARQGFEPCTTRLRVSCPTEWSKRAAFWQNVSQFKSINQSEMRCCDVIVWRHGWWSSSLIGWCSWIGLHFDRRRSASFSFFLQLFCQNVSHFQNNSQSDPVKKYTFCR